MDNKDEKTFDNIFNQGANNNTTQTKITFDNLYDNLNQEPIKQSQTITTQTTPPTTNPFFVSENTHLETKTALQPDYYHLDDDDNDGEDTNTNPFLTGYIDVPKEILTNKQPEISTKDNLNNQSENPFFTNNTITKAESPISILPEKKDLPNETPARTTSSINPFFAETNNRTTQEINPFFQNQINLIENIAPATTNSTIDITNSKHYNVKVVKKKEPLIKSILGVLSYALFIWLLLVGVALLIYVLDIKIRAAKGDYSAPTFNAYVVLTGSMLPAIKVNDVVVTKKVEASQLQEGDVITFLSADPRFNRNTIITHRIIKKNPPTATTGYTFQTQGDNNNVADQVLVPENNIYGKVIIKIPKLGYLKEFLATDGGWIIVILIPCLTVMSYDIVKLIKGLKRRKYKNIKIQK